jgi:hypothetical protein
MHQGKVFGIGLSRTGTRSLAAALNQLGIKTRWFPCDPTTFTELLSGNLELTLLREYQGLTDTPAVPYYPQFDRLYAGSKFILTVRDQASWLQSVEKHWTNFGFTGPEPASAPFWRIFGCFINCCVYGCHGFNAERFAYVYETHLANVQRYFAGRPESLLVMDICAGQGWEMLCPFLGCPVPETPFPRVDKTFSSPDLR